MDVKEMSYVVTIAETGSVTQAAESLFITQSALSNALITLEKQLGFHIFQRKTHRLLPTQMGEIYIKYAREILELDRRFHEQVNAMMQKEPELIRVAVSSLNSVFYFETLERHLSARFPDSTIQLIPANGEQAQAMLERGEAEFSVGSVIKQKKSIVIIPLYRDYIVAAIGLTTPAYSKLSSCQAELLPKEQLSDLTVCIRSDSYVKAPYYTDEIIKWLTLPPEQVTRSSLQLPLLMQKVVKGDLILVDTELVLLPYKTEEVCLLRLATQRKQNHIRLMGAYNKEILSDAFAQKLTSEIQCCFQNVTQIAESMR